MTTPSSSHAGRPASVEAVDTRTGGGPDGRLYTASFAAVWDRVLEEVRARGRWELVHHDEELGLITVRCRGFMSTGAGLLTVWVSLDDNGLTRLDLRSVPETRRDLGAGERRIRELLGSLDHALGAGARVSP
ncbi:MAG: hypothetical protein WBO43_11920 [Gemmatimonadota bacterium]